MAKPTYSTCIGLILKGYDDYEHKRKEFEREFKKLEVPDGLKQPTDVPVEQDVAEAQSEKAEARRKNLTGFWGKFKDRIIDLFKEEEDKHL